MCKNIGHAFSMRTPCMCACVQVDRVYKLQANQGPLGLALQRGVLTLAATPLSSLQVRGMHVPS